MIQALRESANPYSGQDCTTHADLVDRGESAWLKELKDEIKGRIAPRKKGGPSA